MLNFKKVLTKILQFIRTMTVTSANVTMESGWAAYSSGTSLAVTKQGNIVNLCGAFQPTNAVTIDSTPIKIGTVPNGYRPTKQVNVLIQSSGVMIAHVRVNASGSITVERLRTMNSTSYQQASAGYWFPVNTTWSI